MPPPDLDEIPGDKDVDDDEDSTENDPLLKPQPPPQKPPDPYAGSHSMSRLDPERSGLPKPGPKTEETSFITGEPSGRVLTVKDMATLEVEKDFPNMDHSKVKTRYRLTGTGTVAIIEVKMRNKTKGYPLYTKKRGDTEKTFNDKLPLEIKAAIDLFEGVQIKETEIQQKVQEIEEVKRTEGLQMM